MLAPAVSATRVAVRRALSDLQPGRVVAVACSGGADSVALLAAAVAEARRPGWPVLGVTVDHGLQEGSAERADRVVEQMAGIGADETTTVRVSVEPRGRGPEAAAREARYAVLAEVATRAGAAAVLLGHTRDDQAETVLLGLARGSGGRSLAGMRRAFEVFRRPLLDLTRAQTEAACRAEGLQFWQDPHNDDPRFTRSRVRRRVLPVLEDELGPGVAAALARTADGLREDMAALDELAEQSLRELTTAAAAGGGPSGALPVAALAELPPALRHRVLRLAALAAGSPAAELFRSHVLALDALVTDWHGQAWVDLPGPVRGQRHGGARGAEVRLGPPADAVGG